MLFGGSDYRYNQKCIFFSFNKRRESRPGTRFPKVPVTFHGSKSKSGHPSLQTSSFCLVNGSVNHVVFKSFEKYFECKQQLSRPVSCRDFRKTGPSFVTGCIHMDLFCASLYAHTILVELSVNSFGCFFFPPILLLSSYHMPPPSPTSEKSYNLGRSWLITLET